MANVSTEKKIDSALTKGSQSTTKKVLLFYTNKKGGQGITKEIGRLCTTKNMVAKTIPLFYTEKKVAKVSPKKISFIFFL